MWGWQSPCRSHCRCSISKLRLVSCLLPVSTASRSSSVRSVPRIVHAPLLAAQGSAVGSLLDRVGLVPSSLNAIVDHFEPSSSDRLDAAIRWLALNIELAKQIGSPRVVIWDGLDDPAESTEVMTATLLQCVERGVAAAGNDGPAISVEFHPNTFALARGVHGDVAHRLKGVGAGVCLDFCHFGVALSARFVDALDDDFIGCVNHIHVADSDCLSEQLHFPLDEGVRTST